MTYKHMNGKVIGIDLSKKQPLHTDSKAIQHKSMQQINFIGNLEWAGMMFFIFEEVKETILDFSQETTRVL